MACRKMLTRSLGITTSFRLTRTANPNISPLPFSSYSYYHSRNIHSEVQQDNSATSWGGLDPRCRLVGWWAGVCEEGKVPYGQIIQITENQGRYLAKSYSAWQLATGKNGTPLFEIYATSGLKGEYKEQAIFLKRKAACQDSLGSSEDLKIQVDTGMFPLTDSYSTKRAYQWVMSLTRLAASEGKDTNSDEYKNFLAQFGLNPEVEHDEATEAAADSLEDKTAYYTAFAIGDIVEKPTILNIDLLRVPALLEANVTSISLTLEEDKDSHLSGKHSPEDYCTTDHDLFDFIDCMARGVHRKKDDRAKVTKPKQTNDNLVIRAKNQLPLLSRLTIFKRIDIPASSDPLDGLYIGSNGYLATEVIKITRLYDFEVGGTKDVTEREWCCYLEAVNLTGDSIVPAGQVAFRAKVGQKYMLPPGIFLEIKYGAVARYKGEGRLAGFQDSKVVDVEILILGEKYIRDGFPIGVLYSAPEYYYFKLFKKLKLKSFQYDN